MSRPHPPETARRRRIQTDLSSETYATLQACANRLERTPSWLIYRILTDWADKRRREPETQKKNPPPPEGSEGSDGPVTVRSST